ncbi:MAG: hypothetical protein HOO86_08845 [Bacteroidales bacterium]|nr:hypothetical protein [Bacteroidales bacterium]
MKKNIIRLIFIVSFSITGLEIMSQPPAPPSGGVGQGGNQEASGDAPIGSGIGILLTLGAAYGGKKIYELRKKLKCPEKEL